jgi:hypothetical protein
MTQEKPMMSDLFPARLRATRRARTLRHSATMQIANLRCCGGEMSVL